MRIVHEHLDSLLKDELVKYQSNNAWLNHSQEDSTSQIVFTAEDNWTLPVPLKTFSEFLQVRDEKGEILLSNRDLLEARDKAGRTVMQALLEAHLKKIINWGCFKAIALSWIRIEPVLALQSLGPERDSLLSILLLNNQNRRNDAAIEELVGLNPSLLENLDKTGVYPLEILIDKYISDEYYSIDYVLNTIRDWVTLNPFICHLPFKDYPKATLLELILLGFNEGSSGDTPMIIESLRETIQLIIRLDGRVLHTEDNEGRKPFQRLMDAAHFIYIESGFSFNRFIASALLLAEEGADITLLAKNGSSILHRLLAFDEFVQYPQEMITFAQINPKILELPNAKGEYPLANLFKAYYEERCSFAAFKEIAMGWIRANPRIVNYPLNKKKQNLLAFFEEEYFLDNKEEIRELLKIEASPTYVVFDEESNHEQYSDGDIGYEEVNSSENEEKKSDLPSFKDSLNDNNEKEGRIAEDSMPLVKKEDEIRGEKKTSANRKASDSNPPASNSSLSNPLSYTEKDSQEIYPLLNKLPLLIDQLHVAESDPTFEISKQKAMALALSSKGSSKKYLDVTGNLHQHTLLHTLVLYHAENAKMEIKSLIQHNPDVLNYKNLGGRSVLHTLLATNPTIKIEDLNTFQSEENLHHRDNNGESLLYTACEKGNLAVVKYLSTYKLDVETKTLKRQTLLHAAALSGNSELVEWLLNLNTIQAEINAQDLTGNTALDYVTQYNPPNAELITSLLVKYGAASQNEIQIAHTMNHPGLLHRPTMTTRDDLKFFMLVEVLSPLKNYAERSQQRKHLSKARIAKTIYNELNESIEAYFGEERDMMLFTDFCERLLKVLHSQDRALNTYQISWKTLLQNVAIALTGIGILCIIAKLIHSTITEKRTLFFFQQPKTVGERTIERVGNKIDEAKNKAKDMVPQFTHKM